MENTDILEEALNEALLRSLQHKRETMCLGRLSIQASQASPRFPLRPWKITRNQTARILCAMRCQSQLLEQAVEYGEELQMRQGARALLFSGCVFVHI